MSWPPPAARPAVSPSRARRPLLFRLRAASCISSSHKTDDLATGSRSASMASAGNCRRTRNVLSGLVGDEFVEIGVGEHAALTALAVAKDDVFQRAGSDVTVERLDRAAELARSLGGRAQAVRWGLAQLALVAFGGRARQRDRLPPEHHRNDAVAFLARKGVTRRAHLNALGEPRLASSSLEPIRPIRDIRGLDHVPPAPTALHRSSRPGSLGTGGPGRFI